MYVGPWQEFNLMRALYGGRPVRAPPRHEVLDGQQQQHQHSQRVMMQDQFTIGSSTASDNCYNQHQSSSPASGTGATGYDASQFIAAATSSRTVASHVTSSTAYTATARSGAQQEQQQHPQVSRGDLLAGGPRNSAGVTRGRRAVVRVPVGPASDPGTRGRATRTRVTAASLAGGGRGGQQPQHQHQQQLTSLLRTSRATDEEIQSFAQHGNRFIPPPAVVNNNNSRNNNNDTATKTTTEKRFLTQKSADPTDRVRRREALAKLYAGNNSNNDGVSGRSSPAQHQHQHHQGQQSVSNSIQDFAGVFSGLTATTATTSTSGATPIHLRQQMLQLPDVPDPVDALAGAQFVGRNVLPDYLLPAQRNRLSPDQHQHHQHQQEQSATRSQQQPQQRTTTVGGLINANVFSLLKRASNNELQQQQAPFQVPTLQQPQQHRNFDVAGPMLVPPLASITSLSATRTNHQMQQQQRPSSRQSYATATAAPMQQQNQQHRHSPFSPHQRTQHVADIGAPVLIPPVHDSARAEIQLQEMQRRIVQQAEHLQQMQHKNQQQRQHHHHQQHVAIGDPRHYAEAVHRNQREFEQHHHHHTGDSRVGLFAGRPRVPSPLDPASLDLARSTTANSSPQQQQSQQHQQPQQNASRRSATSTARASSPLSPMSSSFGMTHDTRVNELLSWAQSLDSGNVL